MFTRATKTRSKLKMGISGVPGSGKSFTALTIAHALASEPEKVAVIDTEAGRASKYADQFPPFDVVELETFHPDLYIEAIRTAEAAGYEVLIVDSLSHAWDGSGGILEILDTVARQSKNNNSFTAWGDVTPIHNRLINAILRSKLHVICTMRSKMEYVQEINPQTNRTQVRRIGLAPVQRANTEYEFDVYGDMDQDHTLTFIKSMCVPLQHAVLPYPDASLANTLKEWLSGKDAETMELASLMAQITTLRPAVDEPVPNQADMQKATVEQLRKERDRLTGKLVRMKAAAR